MKVLFLTTHLNYGGITSYILNLAEGLLQKDIKVFVASSGGVLEEKLETIGGKHIWLPLLTKSELNPKLFLAATKLINFIHKEKIQILHTNTRVSQVVGWICGKFSDIHLVSTAHGFYAPRLGRRIFPCWGEKIIVISQPLRQYLLEKFYINTHNIRLIRNGIDVERFNPSVKTLYSDRVKKNFDISNCPVIGTISRLSDVKGIEYILMAVAKLKESYNNIICLIVGSGKEYDRIKKLISRLEIAENIRMVSPLWDIERMLSVMDIFISASLQEGLGLSLIEAMGCGIPVIATKVGGVVDVIDDKNNGVLIPPADANLLTQKVKLLLENRNVYKKISNQAVNTVQKEFNINKNLDLTVKVYSEVL